MKTLKKISLTQFRNYSSAFFDFPTGIICITGKNGTGKTNLLDAIYYLCFTKSYFSSTQQNSAQKGTDGFKVEGMYESNTISDVVRCRWQRGKKEIFVNDVLVEKVTDYIGTNSAVMIAPDDLEIINGASEKRRKWTDSILCQVDKKYFEALIHYQKVCTQRNAWLKAENKKPTNEYTQLEYYDNQLVASGSYIYNERCAFINELLPILNSYYSKISGNKEDLSVSYISNLHEKKLIELLKDELYNDLFVQRTTKGVHRDDLAFGINDFPLKQFASQGQKKSYLFALKLAQYEYLQLKLDSQPALLLDDIFEKLDDSRTEALMSIIKNDISGQVFLTDTNRSRVSTAIGASENVTFLEL